MTALNKVFTARFYAQHTGFFLLLFYLFFGVVQGPQLPAYHYSLMMGFITNTDFLLLALLAWLLYNMKCMGFVLKMLSQADHLFLYDTLGILQGPRKWRTWAWLHASLYMPALVYSCIAAVLALRAHYYLPAAVMLLFNGLMIVSPLWIYEKRMQHPGAATFLARWGQWLHRRLPKPLWLYYPYELLNGNGRSFALTKIASALVLLLTFALAGEEGDVRALLLGLLVCVLVHGVIVYNHRSFDDAQLHFVRGLPLPLWRRYLHTAAAYLLLLLPEYILLWVHTGPGQLPLLVLFSVSTLLLFRSLLYFPRLDQDRYFRWVFVIFFLLLFLVLGHGYWWGAAAAQAAAAALFAWRYYRYEG